MELEGGCGLVLCGRLLERSVFAMVAGFIFVLDGWWKCFNLDSSGIGDDGKFGEGACRL